MKTILLGLILAIGASAQMVDAQSMTKSASFRISSIGDFGSRIYYNCDSVENQVASMMERFGATNVSVRCTGGLDPWGGFATEAFVRLTMDVLVSDANGAMRGEYQEVSIRSFDNCHLLKEISENTHGLFDVRSLNYTKTCTRSNSRFRLKGEFLK